jgi:hypothetical protein
VLNELLHAIVARLGHPSESQAEELHALVDAAVPVAAPDDADAPTPDGTPAATTAKAK